MRRMWVNWLAIALLPLAVVACALPRSSATPTPSGSPGVESASPSPAVSESPTPRGEIDSLEKARAAWASGGTANYDFVISRQCFCLVEYVGPFTVRVRCGASTVSYSSDGSAVDPDVLRQLPVSAEELFQFAQEHPVAVTYAPVPSFRKLTSVAELHPYPWLKLPAAGSVRSFSSWRQQGSA